MNKLLTYCFLMVLVTAEGYYCPYPDLGATSVNDLLYDYYSLQGTVYIRLGETGWEDRATYCSAKGDLSIHSDAGQVKCEDSQGTCLWSGSSCDVNPNKQPDCHLLCETILNGGGLPCLGSDCPGGGDRSVIYSLCDGVTPTTDTPSVNTPNAPVGVCMPRV